MFSCLITNDAFTTKTIIPVQQKKLSEARTHSFNHQGFSVRAYGHCHAK